MTSKDSAFRGTLGALFALAAAGTGWGCSGGSGHCEPTSACDAPDGGHEEATTDGGTQPRPDTGTAGSSEAGTPEDPHDEGGIATDAAVPLAFLDTELPPARYNATIVYALRYRGGTGVPEFTVKSGRLPKGTGLLLDGTIFGTPYEWGDFEFEVELKAGNEVTTREFAWRVTTTMSLAYLSDDREPGIQELFVADIGGGAPYARAAVARADYFNWMRDGKAIAFTLYTDTVSVESVVDLDGATPGNPKKMWEGPSTCSRQWSPDESTLAVGCDREIRFFPRDEGKAPSSVRVSSPLGWFDWSPDSSRLYLGGDGFRVGKPFAHAVIPASAQGSVDLVPVQFAEPPSSAYATWSPNSQRILLSTRSAGTPRRNDLYLVDPSSAGSLAQPMNLNADRAMNSIMMFAGWTTDGRAAYAQGYPRQIYVLTKDLTGYATNIGTLSEDSLTSIGLVHDDTFIVTYDFSGSTYVETHSPEGSPWERDLVGGYVLSGDLMHNLVVTDSGDGHRLEADKMPSWGSRALNVPSPGNDISGYSYSPDSTRVSFVQKQPDGRFRPFYSDLRSGSWLGVSIGESSTQERFPIFSPDSRFVAYVTAKDGPIDLQVVDVSAQVPGSPVKVNGDGRVGYWPAWQPRLP